MLSFFSLPSPLAYGLLAGVAAVIGLLFLVKPVRVRMLVASTLLWQRAAGSRRPHHRRRRWIVSLVLALLTGLSLALAAARPHAGGARQRIAVVLDNTVSMAARTSDGSTRWNRALESARTLISQLPATGEVLLLDTTGSGTVPAGLVSRDRALAHLTDVRLSILVTGRVPPLPLADETGGAHLFTDGVGLDGVPPGIAVRSVFEAADNVAITGFEARPVPGAPTRYEAFLQIANTGTGAKSVALEVRGTEGFRVTRQLTVAGETATNLSLDVTSVAKGPLRAHISAPGDAFELDDSAYCLVLPHREKRVLLVTAGNAQLEDSLRLLPGVALAVQSPARQLPSSSFDTFVFDRFAPPDPPAAGALLFRPPPSRWLDARWRTAGKLSRLARDDVHPLASGVAWRSVRVHAARVTPAPEGRSVVTADDRGGTRGAVILAGQASARWAAVGFALEDSNLPLQAGFPVFLGNAVNWLAPGPSVTSASVGWVDLPVRDAQVFELAGSRVATTWTPDRTLFEAPRPGVYWARSGQDERMVVVNANDLRMAQINHRRLPGGALREGEGAAAAASWPEPGVLLLGFALILLTAEWVSFSRGATE